MSVSLTDTFLPVFYKAVENLAQNLDLASKKNAYFIQANWTKGIRSQSLKINPVQNWKLCQKNIYNLKEKNQAPI